MMYKEALQILFNKVGKTETFTWLDCNNPAKADVIKEAEKYI